jgi:fucokinase
MTIAQNKLPLEIKINRLEISKETLESINQRLILIYTGITRLAKDLLLNVLRNWYLISPSIYNNVQELVQNAFRCAKALESGKLLIKKNSSYIVKRYKKFKI